jgi:hypothetical protein
LTQDYLWMRTLSLRTSTLTRKDQLSAVNKQFLTAASTSAAPAPIVSMGGSSSGGAATRGGGGGGSSAATTRSGEGSGSYSQVRAEQGFAAMAVGGGGGGAGGGGLKKSSSSTSSSGGGGAAIATNPRTVEFHKAVDQLASVAVEEICQQTLQRAKQQVFGSM